MKSGSEERSTCELRHCLGFRVLAQCDHVTFRASRHMYGVCTALNLSSLNQRHGKIVIFVLGHQLHHVTQE